MSPLCFVLMPFGCKPAGDGRLVDFDAVYQQLIAPAVQAAGLAPLRADEEQAGGVIHKAMFERLILCEFAVADLTSANANVFYELGIRHALRPATTQLLFAEGRGQLPFDVGLLRGLPYRLGEDGRPKHVSEDMATLTSKLKAAREHFTDSPLFQLVEGFPDIQRLKTDVFRERVQYAEDFKARLADARRRGPEAVAAVEAALGDVVLADAGVVIDLMLSYRAVSAWQQLVDLVAHMAPPLAATVMVREQLGMALNRLGQSEEAERVLTTLIHERGASSETCGLLGRVYKDRWQAALKAGQSARALGVLKQAIDAYLQGFENDWRDAYPGINAVTLMELQNPPDPRRAALLPVVQYSEERRMAGCQPDYWDHATRLELAVLARQPEAARQALADALAHLRAPWEADTTANNLLLIQQAREARGEADDMGLAGLIAELRAAAG
ncbi:MAG: TRAFs-binding domain-containing protein [Rhodocyclaceae bacterium]